MSELAPARPNGGDIIESVITKGDLARLTPQEKTAYYAEVCRSVGLNPFTRPFEYISLSGKLTLYARREATDQLRRINGISLEVISRDVTGDILTVHVRARDKHGRTDEDFGSVNIKGLAGEALANANMKAITKGKRRVTLSISGLGFLDESEVEDIRHRAPPPAPVSTRAELDQFAGISVAPTAIADPFTGEILDREQIEREARAAAERGTELLRAHWRNLSEAERDMLRDAVGTHEAPGVLLLAAQRADVAAPDGAPDGATGETERQRTPDPTELPLAPAGDPPDAAAASPLAGAAHRWRMPRDPSARDWQAFADWIDGQLADGISGRSLRADNETAFRRLRDSDPVLYDSLQERLTEAR